MPASVSYQRLIEGAAIPGVAVALIEEGRLREIVCYGVRNAHSSDRIDDAAWLRERLTKSGVSK